MQTAIFFIFYWSMVIIAFDDDKEELIEYLDSTFGYFFMFMIVYFTFKHSIHFFPFQAPSVVGTRSSVFLYQFQADATDLFSMLLRMSALLLRLNIYDLLDDVLDFYYIFIGDFDSSSKNERSS
jgi:hypothetical protein